MRQVSSKRTSFMAVLLFFTILLTLYFLSPIATSLRLLASDILQEQDPDGEELGFAWTPLRPPASSSTSKPLCEALRSQHLSFEFELCQDFRESAVFFELKAFRTNTTGINFTQKLSPNKFLDEIFRTQVGPDSFDIIISGPEVLSGLPVFNLTELSYSFYFSFTVNGNYSVVLRHVSDLWDVGEVFKGIRVRNRVEILRHKFNVTVASNWEELQAKYQEFSFCVPGKETENARWMYGSFTSGLTWTAPCLPGCNDTTTRSKVIFGNWTMASVVSPVVGLQWVPMDCKLRTFTPSEARECLRGRPILLVGDSHARMGSGSLIQRILNSTDLNDTDTRKPGFDSLLTGCKNNFPCNLQLQEGRIQATQSNFATYLLPGDVAVSLSHEIHPIDYNPLPVKNFVAIFINFGHWPSGESRHGGQQTVAEYKRRLMKWAKTRLSKWKRDGGKTIVVWTETTPRDKGKNNSFHDSYRFRFMDAAAREVFKGAQTLESFKVILPFASATHDGAHYVYFSQDVLHFIRLNRVCPL